MLYKVYCCSLIHGLISAFHLSFEKYTMWSVRCLSLKLNNVKSYIWWFDRGRPEKETRTRGECVKLGPKEGPKQNFYSSNDKV